LAQVQDYNQTATGTSNCMQIKSSHVVIYNITAVIGKISRRTLIDSRQSEKA